MGNNRISTDKDPMSKEAETMPVSNADDRMEPEAKLCSAEYAPHVSIAVSLKRIADMLEEHHCALKKAGA